MPQIFPASFPSRTNKHTWIQQRNLVFPEPFFPSFRNTTGGGDRKHSETAIGKYGKRRSVIHREGEKEKGRRAKPELDNIFRRRCVRPPEVKGVETGFFFFPSACVPFLDPILNGSWCCCFGLVGPNKRENCRFFRFRYTLF